MTSKEIIDISDFTLSRRQQKRRFWLRILIPVLCVVLMVGAILGIAAYSYTNTRQDALALTDSLILSLEQRISLQVNNYLTPMSNMAEVAAGLIKLEGLQADKREIFESFGKQTLKSYPQSVAFGVGDTLGNFLMTKKMPDGSIHTKHVERRENRPHTTWTRRDPAGDFIKKEKDENERYDARSRPWYQGAVRSPGIFWTEIYIFFTGQKPGVTAALAVRDALDELKAVIMLDILLEELSAFIERLKIGDSGQAMIIDSQGYLIAYPDLSRLIKQEGDDLRPVTVPELGDPVLTRAYDRFRVEKHGTRYLTVDNRQYISLSSPIPLAGGQSWSLLIVVLEEDFLGFVRQNISKALFMTLVVIVFTAFLASLLAWQGVRADRNAHLLLSNRRQFESQSQAFSDLASEVALFDPDNTAAVERITEIMVNAIQVRRASIWRLTREHDRLVCEDAYDRESDGHTRGNVLMRQEFENFFKALEESDTLKLSDASQDKSTRELHHQYLNPLGCHNLLISPIRLKGRMVGAVFFEGQSASRTWSAHEATFAKAIAGLLALRFEARSNARVVQSEPSPRQSLQDSPRPLAEISEEPPGQDFSGIAGRTQIFYERMERQGLSRKHLAVEVFTNTGVLALQFTNPFILAQSLDSENVHQVMQYLSREMETLARWQEIDYLKIMGNQMIAAAGSGQDVGARLQALANMALELQDRCRHVFADLDADMVFRMGLDMGSVMGSIVGEKENYYNLWGDAIHTASLMAEAGIAGCIQVTESAYHFLQSQYVFKKRGAYYLEESFEIQTYLLTSRL